MEEPSADLEHFRRKWREEVSARSKQPTQNNVEATSSKATIKDDKKRPEKPVNKPPTRHPISDVKDDDSHDTDAGSQSDIIEKIEGLRLPEVDEDNFSQSTLAEPKSALEHYEKAVEKESQGSLGDSLALYRKAYRMDAKVDQSYKNKHFPHKWKPSNPSSSTVSASKSVVTVPPTISTTPVVQLPKEAHQPLTSKQLILSFADLEILNADPIIEGDKPPPCPIRRLPLEVMLDLLQHVACQDPSAYARLALVCKKLAFHVFTENSIWKRVALGPEFGLASQRYHFATDLQGRDVVYQALEDDNQEEAPLPIVTETMFGKEQDWRDMFHSYPRIRFTGVYISTVNYSRSGGPSATLSTWGTQVHIVTYYRYLRFFRDGTAISLLTTHEPLEVVHHLTKENLAIVRSNGKDTTHGLNLSSSAAAPLPLSRPDQLVPPTAQNIMKHALRGRWRLCHPSLETIEIGANNGVIGDLHIETEGAGPRYVYTMHLALKSGSRNNSAAKNNKLQWKGFWSYNQLTDDWSEFHLRNDKPFFFSRVRSYGLGY